ncbi:MAG: hypothetical protein WCE44_16885 [Candidatus Velthaea sp.]|jgi:hypothetical protein
MIAPQLFPAPSPRERGRARSATKRRTQRARRRNTVAFGRIIVIVAAAALPVLIYVMLTAWLTSTSYALAHATQAKAHLLEESQRLDDRIARLESPERLALVAAQLHMHDPHVYAVVNLPDLRAPEAPRPIAFFGAASWLKH